MASFKEQLEACMQNDPPPCAAECPFALDVRAFAAHLKRGAFAAAYRMYRDATAFPGIVSRLCPRPCEGACVYAGADCGVALRELERAAVAHTPNPRPNRYNLPKRAQRIVVVGAGPAGLACALRLASKKYAVTVCERAERCGGSLRGLLPDEVLEAEIAMQFMHETVDFRFGTEIRDLADLDADAVCLATGRGGEAFGLALSDTGECASTRRGVFLCGGLVGRGPVEAIADGLTAARAIERYLKTGGMNEPFRSASTRFHPDPALLPPPAPTVTAGDGGYTPEEAAAEAARCRECRCDACVTYCDLMRSRRKYPRRIEEEVSTTIEPVSLSRKARLATRLIAACDHCGLCKAVCPAGIDTGAFLLESQRKMQEIGAMPWAFHEFWLRDMAFADGEAGLCLAPSGAERQRYLFFPGCRLSGSSPELAEKSYDFLRSIEPDSAILLGCCGAPASWAGRTALHEAALERLRAAWRSLGEPTLVFACMNCQRAFGRYLPEMSSVSLYELLDEHAAVEPSGAGARAAVFDPCSARDCGAAQRAVRSLAEKAGYRLEALPMEGKYARCCGWGGHVSLSNPDYAGDVTRSRAQESDAPYFTYCASCRDVFAGVDKPAAHILEAVFSAPAWERGAVSASDSRDNRRALKRRLQERYAPEEVMPVEQPKIALQIAPALLEKMDRDHLLREDAELAVLRCEEDGRFLVDPERGSRSGHVRIGNATVWVEYRADADGCTLLNAYAHRMRIVEGRSDG